MRIAGKIDEVRSIINRPRSQGDTIGLVPTMGAIHAGHLSLVQRAVQSDDFVVVSIFVNPTQFGPEEDYQQYPRQLEADAKLLEAHDVDLIFSPTPRDMYPPGYATFVEVERLTEKLCGRYRDGHFRGVTTVVTKLFNIITPDRAYFGQKDYQQYLVLDRMTKDLNMPVEIVRCDIVREPDGLAISSRNEYLTPKQRAAAPSIYRALQEGAQAVRDGASPDQARQIVIDIVEKEPPLEVQYVEAVDPQTLKDPDQDGPPMLLAAAVFAGDTRLIDNTLVEE